MSRYKTTPDKIHLTADAGDPTTEVFVIDGYFNLLVKGCGRIEADLAPGLYKVKFVASSFAREVHVALEPGSEPVYVTAPDLPFSTAAPIEKTNTTHEYHADNAHRLSTAHPHLIGTGSQLFVFVRDVRPQGSDELAADQTVYPLDDPATGLTLHDLNGNLLVDFAMVGEKATQSPVLDNWSGCNIQLDPGAYRLRVQAGSVGRLEQIVVTSLSWQTQVFLLRREYGGDSPPVRRADLGNASVLMLRIGQGFHSKEAHLRQTELARHGLAHGRVVMQPDELNKMLWMKSDNPMLGIYGAHLLLLSQEPDRNLLRTVTANLHSLVGDHPDVTALDIWLGDFPSVHSSYPVPPMLRSSWKIVVEASITYPDIVPTGSFAAQIADHIWGNSAWLLWQNPPTHTVPLTSLPAELSVLHDAVPQITAKLAEMLSSEPVKEFAQSYSLSNLERVLLDYVSFVTSRRGHTASPSELDSGAAELQSVNWTHLTRERLVQALHVPYATIREAVTGLVEKLTLPSP